MNVAALMHAAQRSVRIERTERGASLVEYALLLAFIAVVCIAAVAYFGGSVTDSLSRTGSQLP